MLIDSDVLIGVLRGSLKAAARVEEIEDRCAAVVTLMELIQGVRDRHEVRLIKDFLSESGFRTIPLTEMIGHRAVISMEQHGLRSGLRMADALIASTAVENGLPLLSGNARRYRMLTGLDVVPFKP